MCPSQADEAAIQPDPRVRAPQRGELLGRGPQGQEDGEQDQTEQVREAIKKKKFRNFGHCPNHGGEV